MAKQSKAQKKTIESVMHEFKHGELEQGRSGRRVKNPKQAVAIALHEAGASKDQSPAEKRKALSRTKAKVRSGRSAGDSKEAGWARGDGKTKAALYAEAKKRDIPGRSHMSKQELERALGA